MPGGFCWLRELHAAMLRVPTQGVGWRGRGCWRCLCFHLESRWLGGVGLLTLCGAGCFGGDVAAQRKDFGAWGHELGPQLFFGMCQFGIMCQSEMEERGNCEVATPG